MLNISPENKTYVDESKYDSIHEVKKEKSSYRLMKWVTVFFILLLVSLFLPWTQNIRSKGKLTTLRPEQRPQTINTIIGGRIEQWFVKDGDFVKKGDTILFLSEVKEEYMDTMLIDRTRNQIKNKEQSVRSYGDKVSALDARIDALIETAELKNNQVKIKYQQVLLKIKSDSIENLAAKKNYEIAVEQYKRFEKLYQDKLKSLTELETREVAMQRAQAALVSSQQKLLQSRNDLIDARVELNSIQAQYRDEIAKAESDKMSALTNLYDAEVDVTKMQSQAATYDIRNGMYYILAPQDGYVTKILSSGIGETIKPGQEVATIMPANTELAVEMFIRPMDVPLVKIGQKVRLQFDGWPAVVFSGWPNTSYGTYGGIVFAMDKFATADGTFRLLITPDANDNKWPEALRVGGGVNAMLLLNDVPVWYELWRNINGFPPDYYQGLTETVSSDKKTTK